MDNYIITKTENINYLQYKKLLEFQDKLIHAIFYKAHNVGFSIGEDEETRNDTIEKIENHFKINKSEIIQSIQIHSDNIKEFKNNVIEENIIKNYDAFIVNKPNIASIITFADCIPIFIYDCKQNIYANIHSGWRGVVQNITLKAINTLTKKYNSNITNLICCIGPNIRKECFLVNEDLVEIYNDTFDEIIRKNNIIEETELYNERGKQYRIDNNLLLKTQLKQCGIIEKNIIDSKICTVCNSNDFHSRRVEGEKFQRNGGLMMLRKN